MLKAELHIHIDQDPMHNLQYSVYDIIKLAKKKKFDVIAITMHNKYFTNSKAIKDAKDKGIILIPGIEKNIEGKHTLIYNADKSIEKINTYKELEKYKEIHPNCLIIAAHPFYVLPECHKFNILKHYNLFDVWEFSYFYTNLVNPNKKLLRINKKYKKPIIGTSDVHRLSNFGRTYTLIDAKKSKLSIINAIKTSKVGIITSPVKLTEMFQTALNIILKKE